MRPRQSLSKPQLSYCPEKANSRNASFVSTPRASSSHPLNRHLTNRTEEEGHDTAEGVDGKDRVTEFTPDSAPSSPQSSNEEDPEPRTPGNGTIRRHHAVCDAPDTQKALSLEKFRDGSEDVTVVVQSVTA
jgi:hypothetical protein